MTYPHISIIIPVYNVEPYLRQCLDSVANQTMRDIQIICVNDGSTDGSVDILEEYAAMDSRFVVVHQNNSGAGTARNTGLRHATGKYAYFADPDDWIELDLCEKLVDKLEETLADAVYIKMINTQGKQVHDFDHNLPNIRVEPQEKRDLLLHFSATFLKMWKTSFLTENEIWFSEGKRPNNDVFQNWKGAVLANRIAILDERLYHHRLREGSYQHTFDSSHYVIIDTWQKIGDMLRQVDLMSEYYPIYTLKKLNSWFRVYNLLDRRYRREFLIRIQNHLTEDDYRFVREDLSQQEHKKLRNFYLKYMAGTPIDKMRFHLKQLLKDTEKILKKNIVIPLRRLTISSQDK